MEQPSGAEEPGLPWREAVLCPIKCTWYYVARYYWLRSPLVALGFGGAAAIDTCNVCTKYVRIHVVISVGRLEVMRPKIQPCLIKRKSSPYHTQSLCGTAMPSLASFLHIFSRRRRPGGAVLRTRRHGFTTPLNLGYASFRICPPDLKLLASILAALRRRPDDNDPGRP